MAIYDHYYSGSDVNIYLRYVPSGRIVHLDKAIGVGFSHSMSTIPIYTLGNVNPSFFSRGNSLVQGSLDIVFKSEQYLQKTINYLINKEELNSEKEKLEARLSQNGTLDSSDIKRLALLQNTSPMTMKTTSISDIMNLFEIQISFDNSNSTTEGKLRTINLEGIKFTGEMMSIHSSEENAIVDRYTFLGKNKR